MSLPKIQHPLFEAVVPSTKQTVKFRPMLVKEEKILLMAKESGDPRDILAAVKQVVNNCLVTEGVDVDQLALFDIDYLYVKLRTQSVSSKAQVAFEDKDDGKTYPFEINLDELEVKFPENIEKNIKVSDTVGIVMRYPPASLYTDPEFRVAEGDRLFELMIQKSIETIYDGKTVIDPSTMPSQEVMEWVENLEIKVFNKVKEFFNNLPTLHHELKWTNKNGKERVQVLSTLNDFFFLG